ncbi:MAG: hypothetical protein AAF321_08360 [Pseudomonadota bacterium]
MSNAQYAELDTELMELAAEFEELGIDDEATEELSALNAELRGTDLGEDMEVMAFSMSDDPEINAFFVNWIKNKARKLIRKLIALARRYGDCAQCVGKVTNAVKLFKQKNYVKALWEAKNAYNCIRKCTRK